MPNNTYIDRYGVEYLPRPANPIESLASKLLHPKMFAPVMFFYTLIVGSLINSQAVTGTTGGYIAVIAFAFAMALRCFSLRKTSTLITAFSLLGVAEAPNLLFMYLIVVGTYLVYQHAYSLLRDKTISLKTISGDENYPVHGKAGINLRKYRVSSETPLKYGETFSNQKKQNAQYLQKAVLSHLQQARIFHSLEQNPEGDVMGDEDLPCAIAVNNNLYLIEYRDVGGEVYEWGKPSIIVRNGEFDRGSKTWIHNIRKNWEKYLRSRFARYRTGIKTHSIVALNNEAKIRGKRMDKYGNYLFTLDELAGFIVSENKGQNPFVNRRLFTAVNDQVLTFGQKSMDDVFTWG